MIQFEILKGPDDNVVSPFKFFQNQVYIGKSDGDLWIQDPELKSLHVMLEVVEKDLIIHPQKEVEFYLINGKRASTVRKLKVNDELTLGKTVFKIQAFEETSKPTKKETLDSKLQELLQTNSPRVNLVELLTQKMK